MGMDVYGKEPSSETGKYFRNNAWWWRPLANYVLVIAPHDLTSQCKHWQSNDGAGLDAKNSRILADLLDAEIASGRTETYAQIRQAEIDQMPDEKCSLCGGTGIRDDVIGQSQDMPNRIAEIKDGDGRPNRRAGEKGWCNSCRGAGVKRPSASWYSFDVENVRGFVAFLRDCGGFEIH